MWKNKGFKIWLIVTVILVVLLLAVNIIATQWLMVSKTLDQVFGGPEAIATGDGAVLFTNTQAGNDLEYYDVGSGLSEKADALNAANDLNKKICEEGTVLLKNENSVLPLAEGTKVSVFGKNSVNLVYGGSGSASSDRTGAKTIFESLDAAGIK